MSAQHLAAIAFQTQMAAIALGQQQVIVPEPPKAKSLKAHQMATALNIHNNAASKPALRINQPRSGAARIRNEPCRHA